MSTVYGETARRLSQAGYRWRALRTVWDVDRPEDLARLEGSGERLRGPGLRARRFS
jgi:glycosyltransferase A (GT-A) superfamily protein (DUF2064 family)